MNTSTWSRHALSRAQQRGITLAQAHAIIKYADKNEHRGKGVQARWISKKRLKELGSATEEGIDTDRLRNLIVLTSPDDTFLTMFKNGNAKNYRRKPIKRNRRRR